MVHNEAGFSAPRQDGDHRDGLGVALHGLTPLDGQRGLVTNLRRLCLSNYISDISTHL